MGYKIGLVLTLTTGLVKIVRNGKTYDKKIGIKYLSVIKPNDERRQIKPNDERRQIKPNDVRRQLILASKISQTSPAEIKFKWLLEYSVLCVYSTTDKVFLRKLYSF